MTSGIQDRRRSILCTMFYGPLHTHHIAVGYGSIVMVQQCSNMRGSRQESRCGSRSRCPPCALLAVSHNRVTSSYITRTFLTAQLVVELSECTTSAFRYLQNLESLLHPFSTCHCHCVLLAPFSVVVRRCTAINAATFAFRLNTILSLFCSCHKFLHHAF